MTGLRLDTNGLPLPGRELDGASSWLKRITEPLESFTFHDIHDVYSTLMGNCAHADWPGTAVGRVLGAAMTYMLETGKWEEPDYEDD